jgi:hypothetical protein
MTAQGSGRRGQAAPLLATGRGLPVRLPGVRNAERAIRRALTAPPEGPGRSKASGERHPALPMRHKTPTR